MCCPACATYVNLRQGQFDEETVPVEIPSKRGSPTIISKDEEFTNVSMGWYEGFVAINFLLAADVIVHNRLKCLPVVGLFPIKCPPPNNLY